ncbi:Ca2+ ATPase [Emiliania huxleyi CCMP1516]|uniref:P-type Ca(2+) transporter n=2 Tax=Emiliania huxleyi TaxID=2903 RepID=A0A0D3KGY4_EMIH1|nr:Ca2+ ATPase [Emiliania huxleyi CCMP1516]EOD35019.1 Ca2+ ATPase [Emiliania huxleyi CCMP1516]|eukprot:XP_005787448.1 Ca2+ ATPase [Emiliania huxleyi CCMP1516]
MASERPWAYPTEQVLASHGVDQGQGLADAEVELKRAEFGTNELDKDEGTPLWKLVLQQFDDLLVKILLGAAVLSFVLAFFEDSEEEGLQAFVEPFVILLILIINAVVGVWQEHNAENALEALKELQGCKAKVYRNGQLVPDLPAADLVPGDIVEVSVGDKVPADLRVLRLKTTTVRTDEGALTGESETVMKHTEPVGAEARIQDKTNMMFSGTTLSGGGAFGVVVATGMRTEIGKIQANVKEAAEDEEKTPLGQKIDAFGEMLARVIGLICIAVWVMNFSKFADPVHGGFWHGLIYYLKIAVALGVAAIPEGLPAVITLCLALGTRKMVKRNAIVRKLPSVETLGCTTVICSDKTGTLTTNQMAVVAMAYPRSAPDDIAEHVVTGTSYSPEGEVVGLSLSADSGVLDIARVSALCNQASIHYAGGKYERVGEPTEAALKVLAEKIGLPGVPRTSDPALACCQANGHWIAQSPCNAVLEFSRDRKSIPARATRSRAKASGGANMLYCKGAPESVLPRCTRARLANGTTVSLSAPQRDALLAYVSGMAARPLRCLALAIAEDVGDLADYDGPSHPAHHKLVDTAGFASIEKGMTFVGLVGIKDPARPEVAPAIASCNTAGIRVVMITGDTKPTAEAIAREIGIFPEGESLQGRSFTGAEFFALSAEKRRELLTEHRHSMVFSRTEPRDKQELVKILRTAGEVPAMTGDGVNDAPALKQAAIGVAMGIAGTEVAKEAADMILADDNFATIVAAVEEGRAIYMNMKAFIRYLISSNIGEVASIFLTALLGFPEGLIPVQLLWVNLVTDGPPATALGFNPPDPDIMRRPPRRADDQLITPWVFFRYMVVGLYVGFATVGVFGYWYTAYDWSEYGHPLISVSHLSNWGKCSHFGEMAEYAPDFTTWAANGGLDLSAKPCDYMTGRAKNTASTLSLSVLVTIEMFNALNAISEDGSLLQVPPWVNPWLLLAMFVSFGLHFVIMYVPVLATIFSIVPLTLNDWLLVLAFSFPVIIVDEALKLVGRVRERAAFHRRMEKEE